MLFSFFPQDNDGNGAKRDEFGKGIVKPEDRRGLRLQQKEATEQRGNDGAYHRKEQNIFGLSDGLVVG